MKIKDLLLELNELVENDPKVEEADVFLEVAPKRELCIMIDINGRKDRVTLVSC